MHKSSAQTTAPYISIKDAAMRYQKAEITIRRFVRSVLEQEKSTDRAFVRPLPADTQKLKKMRKPFSYTISEELLKRHYGDTANSGPAGHGAYGSYVHLLERTSTNLEEQLKVKDDQIRVLSKAIDDLSERQRETNILMKGLQERLLLPAPKEGIVDVRTAAVPAKKGKGSKKKQTSLGWWKLW